MKWLTGLVVVLVIVGCAVGASAPGPRHPSLRIAAWNIEHLAARDGEGCRPRAEADYAEVRSQIERLDADVIAFQEIESEAAARRVFDPAEYVLVVENRPPEAPRPCSGRHAERMRTPLTVGFAIRRGLEFTREPDLAALSVGDPERPHGVDVLLRPREGRPLRLLAVHLKAGCATDDSDPRCPGLYAQQTVLRDWIAARQKAGERFAVAGDFNRELARPGDRFWTGLTANGALKVETAAGTRPSICGRARRNFIDHILLGGEVANDVSAFSERAFLPGSRKPSDHCPVRVTIRT